MSLKFTALEVGSGDAFLLENGEEKILFDSGGSKTKIVSLLKAKGIKRINLAVCSHNDKDHSNGFLGLLNSSIHIDEIWLPGTWASIIHSMVIFMKSDYWYCVKGCFWIDLFKEYSCHFEFEEDAHKANYNELLSTKEEISNEQLKEELSFIINMLEDGCWEYCRHCENKEQVLHRYSKCRKGTCLYPTCKEFRIIINIEYPHVGISFKNLMIQLDTIIRIAEAALKNNVNIRWFEPIDACTNRRVCKNIILLNARTLATAKRINNLHMLALAMYLTMENKYSLAMEYLHDGNPVVRFSADSDSTCQSNTPYNNNIIITAPHHGSDANASVYGGIKGNDIIWVRSDSKSRKRPCADFKSQINKYCLACYTQKIKSEISFEYDNKAKRWMHITGNCCKC